MLFFKQSVKRRLHIGVVDNDPKCFCYLQNVVIIIDDLLLFFIRSATDGLWVYEDASIPVKAGDTINFWILVFINGGGYQKTDQSGEMKAEG